MRSIINPRDFVVHPVPVNGPQDRMDRLAATSAEQMAFALAFLIGFAPETFDAVLDAAEPCSDNLIGPDEAEPICAQCGSPIGIFLNHGLTWQHYVRREVAHVLSELADWRVGLVQIGGAVPG
ncbi:MAG TPA: hypothetical protein VHZ03_12830 [Trebonia sp.]|nr:hypothetical protein [Trebonia sp.]